MAGAGTVNISEVKVVDVGFHLGNILKLVARQYPNLHTMALEMIQNMVDANVTTGYLEVDLLRRKLIATDNGKGFSKETFERVIGNIGKSIKSDDDYGQFGLAIASGIDKAENYRYISCVKTNKGKPGWAGYVEYSFDKLISDPDNATGVTLTDRNDLNVKPSTWNTRVEMTGLTKDKAISFINHALLISEAGVRFGEKITKLGSQITVRIIDGKGVDHTGVIEPLTFKGRKMEQANYHGTSCGKVYIRPYLCEKKSSTGMLVKVDGKPFRIEWSKVAASAGTLVTPEVQEVLLSGHLEGEIIVENCEWQEQRTGLVQNDALLEFLILVEKWAIKHGTKMIDEVRDSERSQFYQRVGLKVLAMLEPLRKAVPDFMDRGLIQFTGRVSTGHTTVEGKPDDHVRSEEETKRSKRSNVASTDGKPRGEIKDKLHTGVVSPSGSKRIIAKGQIGIAIEFDEMPGSGDRYEIVPEMGLIRINIRHQDFSDTESSDVKLTKYLLLIVRSAIAYASVSAHQRASVKIYESTLLPLLIVEIVGRRRNS